ncbi:uncharacterized protein LOC114520281 [Dendronephthya gigantea]|uniref:uncharacterized protein LOC114520281 n=1 Tax=Dendronephthya gigantea TaxID=151771 RepID=UPI00106B65E1|nr:uncharacterized protein LOC114520281 [Dendronephthya gigantea]
MMFIKIRYGDDELLLCNPQCSINNLLDSIRARCGLNTAGKILDLSDESGLVLRLNDHREEYADIYLKKYSSYILIEKLETNPPPADEVPVFENHPNIPVINYVPLLDNCSTLLPKFKLRVVMDTAGQHTRRNAKSPRPSSRGAAHHSHVTTKTPNKKKRHASKTKTPKDNTR